MLVTGAVDGTSASRHAAPGLLSGLDTRWRSHTRSDKHRERREAAMASQRDTQQHIYELQQITRPTPPATKRRRSSGASQATPPVRQLREALAAYGLDSKELRHLVSLGADLRTLIRTLDMPEELVHLLTLMHELLTPTEQIGRASCRERV